MSEPCKRCECVKPAPTEVTPEVTECSTCKGWFAVSVSTPEELDAFVQRFAP